MINKPYTIENIPKDFYDCHEELFEDTKVTFWPGVTVLVGCNGSGKTSLLMELHEHVKRDKINNAYFNNLTDGGSKGMSAAAFYGDFDFVGLQYSSSEGEGIYNSICRFAGKVGELVRHTIEQGKDSAFVMIDAVDSGMSIDNIRELKNDFFELAVNDAKSKGVDLYIVVSANSFELAMGERCLDVTTFKEKIFDWYEQYSNFIMWTREKHDRRIAEGDKIRKKERKKQERKEKAERDRRERDRIAKKEFTDQEIEKKISESFESIDSFFKDLNFVGYTSRRLWESTDKCIERLLGRSSHEANCNDVVIIDPSPAADDVKTAYKYNGSEWVELKNVTHYIDSIKDELVNESTKPKKKAKNVITDEDVEKKIFEALEDPENDTFAGTKLDGGEINFVGYTKRKTNESIKDAINRVIFRTCHIVTYRGDAVIVSGRSFSVLYWYDGNDWARFENVTTQIKAIREELANGT